MEFVQFDSLDNVYDGDKFLVIYPNGVIVLCWYSRRGYFQPEMDYDFYYKVLESEDLYELPRIDARDSLLVSKF